MILIDNHDHDHDHNFYNNNNVSTDEKWIKTQIFSDAKILINSKLFSELIQTYESPYG